MRALEVKLWRDLRRLRAQALTIAVVVAIGVAGFVGMTSMHASLVASQQAYYVASRFADVFASVRRAPLSLRERLEAIDGVAEVRLSITRDAQVDLAGVDPPITGRFIGGDRATPTAGVAGLDAVTLRSGRWPAPDGAAFEAVINERFAQVRGLGPGSELVALLNGRRERVRVVGTAISPEYVFASRGTGPDDEWFGVLWVDADRLAAALDLRGAFTQVSLRLHPGVRDTAVRLAVDRLLEPYGSQGAVGRDEQPSNKVVSDELRQQRVLGTVLPAIFLAVAVFILNVVMSRQVATQRPQIAALKALGYTDARIALHYLAQALAITALGVVIGLAGSLWIGRGMLALYAEVFRFTALDYRTVPEVVAASALAAALGAAAGAWAAIRAVVRLSPAQAMLPPAPPVFHTTLVERLGWGRRVGAAALMVIRNLERRPLRAALTVTGIASAVALQISGAFWLDAIAHIVDVQYRQVEQGDVIVEFVEPRPPQVVRELRRLPGVTEAEPLRHALVRLRHGARSVDSVITGQVPDARLLRVIDEGLGVRPAPEDGLMVSRLLADALDLRPGDRLEVTFRLGARRQVTLPVVAVAHTMFGRQAWIGLDALNRLARDGQVATGAVLRLDPQAYPAFHAAVKATPMIAAVNDKAGSLHSFQVTTARNLGIFTNVLTAFAVAMAVGITYNAARIALSERAWELASLRVLGMTRAEVSMLLLAELGLELLLALPLGALLGWALAELLMLGMASDQVDFPVVIEPATYAVAALCVLGAGLASALVVRRQVDRLDLVAVLKVRE